jgi:hypothetical protein
VLPMSAQAVELRQRKLKSLSTELRGVLADTMQPANVSLWLRSPEVRS